MWISDLHWSEFVVRGVDRAEFFDLDTAKKKIKAGQEALIEELATILKTK